MSKLYQKSALVFGEDTRSFLTVIRSLHRQGMLVDVVCFSNNSVALSSNCIRNAYGLNYQSMSPSEWNKAVTDILINNAYDLVIPCDERALFPLLDIKDAIQAETKFALPERKDLGPLFNKVDTRTTAQACDVPVASGEVLPSDKLDFETLAQQYGNPLVLKPTQSYEEEQLNKRQSVLIAKNADSVEKFKIENVDSDILVESYFAGYGIGVSVLATEGEVSAAFAHARVSEPESGGGSSYRKAIAIDPSMLYACQKFCMHMNYTGVAMFEFKYNPKTHDWILIEVNARFWGSLPLAVHAGVDFPALLVKSLLLGIKEPKLHYNLSAYARSFSADIYDIKKEFDQLNSASKFKAFSQLLKRLFSFTRLLTFNDKIDSFAWHDPKPFLNEAFDLIKDKLHGLPYIRTQRQSDRISQFKKSIASQPVENVLFVCYGNIMRSPFARALFEKKTAGTKLSHLNVDSFGFHQIENRNAKPACVDMAKTYDIDLTKHQSKWLPQSTASMPNTLILMFDMKNEYLLSSYYNDTTAISLADLVPERHGFYREIADPYGKSQEYLEHCYQLINDSVDNLIHLLEANIDV